MRWRRERVTTLDGLVRVTLQWGRHYEMAESVGPIAQKAGLDLLQWVRHYEMAERLADFATQLARAELQWGRHYEMAERYRLYHSQWCCEYGFNGAAIMRWRRVLAAQVIEAANDWLQWGRHYEMAERTLTSNGRLAPPTLQWGRHYEMAES